MSDFDDILNQAGAMTDQQLSDAILAVVKVDQQTLQQFFPTAVDKTNLAALMQIVQSSADKNTKYQQIILNMEQYVGTVLSLAQMFIK